MCECEKCCSKCGNKKPLSDFYKNKSTKDGHMEKCKSCVKEYQESNIGKEVRKRVDGKRSRNGKRIECDRKYRQTEAGKLSIQKTVQKRKENGKTNELARNRRRNNTNHRLSNNMRLRIWKALNGINKSNSTKNLLGCTIEEFKKHIKEQFKNDMDWDNYGI